MADKLGPHIERLHAVAGSISGKLFAVGGARDAVGVDNSSVHVFRVVEHKPIASAAVDAPVYALAFMQDDLLIAGTEKGKLVGFAVGEERLSQRLTVEAGTNIRALATDPMGKKLAVVDDDGTLRLYELQVSGGTPALNEVGQKKLSPRPLHAVSIDKEARFVAAAGEDSIIRSMSIGLAGDVREMPCGEGGIFALDFTHDGRLIAGCGDGSIRLVYLEGAVDEEDRSRDAAHEGKVVGVFLGPETFDEAEQALPRAIFSIGMDGLLKRWQIDTKRKPRSEEVHGTPTGFVYLPGSPEIKETIGAVVTSNENRTIHFVPLDRKAQPEGQVVKINSELTRLRQDLRAKGEQVRIDAVNALEKLPEDDARKLLDHALGQDKKPSVRKLAAEAIGRSNRRLSRPALRAALNDADKEVRPVALKALSDIEKDTPLAPVRAALRSSYADIRQIAVEKLPGLREVSPLVPGLVAEKLNDGDAKVRIAALDALYELEKPDDLEPARTAVDRGPPDIRSEALLRLGYANKTSDGDGRVLLEAALDDESPDVRSMAFHIAVGAKPKLAKQLSRVDKRVKKALEKLEKKGKLSSGLIDSLGLGALSDDDRQPLFAALACRNSDTALRGARSLALLGDARATGALLQLSREADTKVRRQVAEALLAAALAMPADDRLTKRLEWLLSDPDGTLRNKAFEALKEISKPEGPEGLLAQAELAFTTSHEDVRVLALQILVMFGGQGPHAKNVDLAKRADELLGDALDDEAPKVRNEAFRTLWAWHSKSPEYVLRRGAGSRHFDVRKKVVQELERHLDKESWAFDLLLHLVSDSSSEVGRAAYNALTDKKKREENQKRADIHLAAMTSPRPDVRALGLSGCHKAPVDELRSTIIKLIEDEQHVVHIAAIEAADALIAGDQTAFSLAFSSIFYQLRVRAGELCGKRRDDQAIGPMRKLLAIPKTHINRPGDELRQRAAAALADVGDPGTITLYVSMLDDEDLTVREMGARGLAGACRPGEEQRLVDALSHGDLAVRSWAAEGLARLGDRRAVPVLAGTLAHEHRPLRLGAIMGLVALGPDGVQGILQGLEDAEREIQDLAFAVIVARDMALARRELPPDLLLFALSSSHPEIRFAAARVLESRDTSDTIGPVALELVGPRRPERASEMKDWPEESRRTALLNVVISALASDHPSQRYASAQVLSRRPQPLVFWREAERIAGPTGEEPTAPPTGFEAGEKPEPRKKDWIRRLFGKDAAQKAESGIERVLTVLKFAGVGRAVPSEEEARFGGEDVLRLVFGTYAGLIRQAPPPGDADETHRVRRDCLARLADLAKEATIGQPAVLPIFRRALSDPHHLVRKAGVTALRSLYPENAVEPLGLALESSAADVGRAAVDELIEAAIEGNNEAAEMAKTAINAPNSEVRSYTLGRLPRLFEKGSTEPWLLALSSKFADVRLSVVDRLVDSRDDRVTAALGRALESDHEDLRFKAAVTLGRRGDARTVDVLGAFLRSEEWRISNGAMEALVSLSHIKPDDASFEPTRIRVSEALGGRLDDDPDKTADRSGLVKALGRVGHPAGDEILLRLFQDDNSGIRGNALSALLEIARDRKAKIITIPETTRKRQRYKDDLALKYLTAAAENSEVQLRVNATKALADVDDKQAEVVLTKLLADRDETVRIEACETLAFRAEYVEGASLDPLSQVLRDGRRELVLPAAFGLARRQKKEAFQTLLLVLKAGEPAERQRAVLAIGVLGDKRGVEELLNLADPKDELLELDIPLSAPAAEALGSILKHVEEPEQKTTVRETLDRLAREGAGQIRTRAITGLRHAGDDHSRGLLESFVSDKLESQGIRQHTITELGKMKDVASEMVLAEVLRDDNYQLRQQALKALFKIFPKERTLVNLLALRSRYTEISQPAASYLSRHGDPAELVARMTEIDDRSVRRRLRQGLVRRGACPQPELTKLLESKDGGSRAEGAWIAGASGERALKDAVTAAWKASATAYTDKKKAGERDVSVEEEAWLATMWAATELGASAAADALKTAIDVDAPAVVRHEALRHVAKNGSQKDAEAIEVCLTAESALVRTAAASTVAALAPDRAPDILKKLAVADAASMVEVVDKALPKAGRDLLGTEAGRQLVLPVVIGKKRTEELIQEAKGKGKEAPRLAAIASLGRISGDESVSALEGILSDKNEEDTVRATAFKALKRAQRIAEKKERMLEELQS